MGWGWWGGDEKRGEWGLGIENGGGVGVLVG